LNLDVSRNRFCDFLADPGSRNLSRFYTNIGRSRYIYWLVTTWLGCHADPARAAMIGAETPF
jgi:hypothetical protein